MSWKNSIITSLLVTLIIIFSINPWKAEAEGILGSISDDVHEFFDFRGDSAYGRRSGIGIAAELLGAATGTTPT